MTGTKVQKSFQTITTFAGISFINEEFSRCGEVAENIQEYLHQTHEFIPQNKYLHKFASKNQTDYQNFSLFKP